jgi:hypothetical protein
MIGLAAGFSGVALLLHILTGAALYTAEAVMVAVPIAATVVVARLAPRPVTREIWRVARAGVLAGGAATLIYDGTRAGLSLLDPSPYNPFEAIRQFGRAVLPPGAPASAITLVGAAIHLVNGSSFGVIYAVFAGRHMRTTRAALGTGLTWGIALEFIQSIVYPGWLKITTVFAEFLLISSLGHVAYGVSLGLGTHRLLARKPRGEDARDGLG